MASSAFVYLLNHVLQQRASSSLLCTFLLLHTLLLLTLGPSPSHMQTFSLTNPHLIHISESSYKSSGPSGAPYWGTEHAIPGYGSVISEVHRSVETVAPSDLVKSGENVVLQDNAARGNHALHLADDGDLREELSMAMTRQYIDEAVAISSVFSTKSSHLLRDSTPEDENSFRSDLEGSRGKKPSSLHLRGTVKAWDIGRAAQSLKDNVPQGDYAFLLQDGGTKVSVPLGKMDNSPLQNDVPHEELSYLLSDGSTKSNGTAGDEVKELHTSEEIALRTSANDRANNKMMATGRGDDDDQSPLAGKVVESGGGGGLKRRRRSRTCTSKPEVCQQMADAELQVDQFIALYGQQEAPSALPPQRQPECCSGRCVNLLTHLSNCGSCGAQCGLSQTCCNGRCADLNTDSSNCGRCGNSCPASGPCEYGLCGYY